MSGGVPAIPTFGRPLQQKDHKFEDGVDQRKTKNQTIKLLVIFFFGKLVNLN